MFGCDSETGTHKTMSKFNSVFKSLEGLKVVTANTEAISKAVDVSVASTPVTRPVYSAAATQRLSKSLRESGQTGFWSSVKDRRYDDVVVATLSKSGVDVSQIGDFLKSEQGAQLGVTLHSGLAKSLGLSAHVKRMFGQWTQRDAQKAVPSVLRKSATEMVEKPAAQESSVAVLKSGAAGFIAKSFIAKDNPYHDPKTGQFTHGGSGVLRSEGKGAVTDTKEYKDKEGVDRVKLRSTVKGVDVTLEMRKDVMDKIRSGEIKVNPEVLPEKWGAGGEDPKREDFDAANGYQTAAEVAEKYGKDSDAARLNSDLGRSISTAWARIEQASNFVPGEALHSALLYKAEQILQHAATDIAPLVEFAKAHDGNLPLPVSRPAKGETVDSEYAKAKKSYGFGVDKTIETAKGVVDVELRYSHLSGSRATQLQPSAGPEVDYKAFVMEKGQPPFMLDTSKEPGLDKKLVEFIAHHHAKGG